MFTGLVEEIGKIIGISKKIRRYGNNNKRKRSYKKD